MITIQDRSVRIHYQSYILFHVVGLVQALLLPAGNRRVIFKTGTMAFTTHDSC
jgi:hypothetical protein